jgi:hypothetical protein
MVDEVEDRFWWRHRPRLSSANDVWARALEEAELEYGRERAVRAVAKAREQVCRAAFRDMLRAADARRPECERKYKNGYPNGQDSDDPPD